MRSNQTPGAFPASSSHWVVESGNRLTIDAVSLATTSALNIGEWRHVMPASGLKLLAARSRVGQVRALSWTCPIEQALGRRSEV